MLRVVVLTTLLTPAYTHPSWMCMCVPDTHHHAPTGHKSAIAVGHSNAFCELFEMLPGKLAQEDQKLENAGVVHAKLVYTRGAAENFTLNSVQPSMLFGSKLEGVEEASEGGEGGEEGGAKGE